MRTAKHNLSHYNLASLKMGNLYPVGLTEVIQGDTFKHSTDIFLRMAPMNAPILHPIWVRLHHWFVPYRILWGGFEDFITAKEINYKTPMTSLRDILVQHNSPTWSLSNYFGLPLLSELGTGTVNVSILPYLAYMKIWAEFYADEQLESYLISRFNIILNEFESKASNKRSGGVFDMRGYGFSFDAIRRVAWFKDYLTTARPSPQLGPSFGVPISPSRGATGKELPTIMKYVTGADAGKTAFVDMVRNRPFTGAYSLGPSVTASYDGVNVDGVYNPDGNPLVSFDGLGKINNIPVSTQQIDLRELRAALALQKIFINRNSYGNRFAEYLSAQGVRYSDRSLQLPQYLGGSKDLIQTSEIVNTTSVNPGSLYGYGIGSMKSNAYIRYFEEPGVVMSLLSIVPKNVYMNGVERMFSRVTQEEYFQSELQFLDMQPIKNKEVYASGNASKDESIFGYQNRYDEFRSARSVVSGEFRTTLKDFHLAREFGSTPVLNNSFIQCNPSNRIFVTQNTDHFYLVAKHKILARRHLTKRANIKIQ